MKQLPYYEFFVLQIILLLFQKELPLVFQSIIFIIIYTFYAYKTKFLERKKLKIQKVPNYKLSV